MYLEYFQMVDQVETLDLETQSIRCTSHVPETSPVFEGHFPGFPLMPGTLLIETIAQAGGFLLMAHSGYQQLPILIQVVKAKIRDTVPPNTRMTVDASIDQISSGIAATTGSIKVDGKRVAECEIRYRTMAFPHDDLRDMVLQRARDIGAPTGEAVIAGENKS